MKTNLSAAGYGAQENVCDGRYWTSRLMKTPLLCFFLMLCLSSFGATVTTDLRDLGNVSLNTPIQFVPESNLSIIGGTLNGGVTKTVIPTNGIIYTNIVAGVYTIKIAPYQVQHVEIPTNDAVYTLSELVTNLVVTAPNYTNNNNFKFKLRSQDTTPGFLTDKISFYGFNLGTNAPTGNARLLVTNTATGGGGETNRTAAGSNVTIATNVVNGITIYTISASLGGGTVTFTDVTNVVNGMILLSNLVSQAQLSAQAALSATYSDNNLNNSYAGAVPLLRKQGPVLKRANEGFWEPSVIYEANPKIITGASSVFKMWASTLTNGVTGIRYGESTNGTDWTMAPTMLLTNVIRSYVVTNGGNYYLFGVSLATLTNMSVYVSSSGTNFSLHKTNVLITSTLASDGWDSGELGNPAVWIEPNGSWWMLFDGTKGSDHSQFQVGLASSSDGTNWTKHAGNPVISNTDFGGGYGGSMQVIRTATNRYVAYALASSRYITLTPTEIYLGWSTNRTNWTFKADPLIARSTFDEGYGTDVGQVADPFAVEVGGTNLFFYAAGTNSNTMLGFGIKLATSSLLSTNLFTNTIREVSFINGKLGVGTPYPTDTLSIRGGGIDFHTATNDNPFAGLDYDRATDAFRLRYNSTITPYGGLGVLDTNFMTMTRGTRIVDWFLPNHYFDAPAAGPYVEFFARFGGSSGPRFRMETNQTFRLYTSDLLRMEINDSSIIANVAIRAGTAGASKLLATDANSNIVAVAGVDPTAMIDSARLAGSNYVRSVTSTPTNGASGASITSAGVLALSQQTNNLAIVQTNGPSGGSISAAGLISLSIQTNGLSIVETNGQSGGTVAADGTIYLSLRTNTPGAGGSGTSVTNGFFAGTNANIGINTNANAGALTATAGGAIFDGSRPERSIVVSSNLTIFFTNLLQGVTYNLLGTNTGANTVTWLHNSGAFYKFLTPTNLPQTQWTISSFRLVDSGVIAAIGDTNNYVDQIGLNASNYTTLTLVRADVAGSNYVRTLSIVPTNGPHGGSITAAGQLALSLQTNNLSVVETNGASGGSVSTAGLITVQVNTNFATHAGVRTELAASNYVRTVVAPALTNSIPGASISAAGALNISIPTNYLGANFGNAVVTNNLVFLTTTNVFDSTTTNVTVLALSGPSVVFVNARSNVNIVAIMEGSASIAARGTLIFTNRTGNDRVLGLSAISNNWTSLQEFDGITAPFTLTNGLAARLDYEIIGTNVQYSFKPVALPK